MIQAISAHGPQAERPLEDKHRFYDELAGEYKLQNPSEVVFELWDFNEHVGDEVEVVHGALRVFMEEME